MSFPYASLFWEKGGNEAGAVEVIEDTLPWVVDLGEVSLFIF